MSYAALLWRGAARTGAPPRLLGAGGSRRYSNGGEPCVPPPSHVRIGCASGFWGDTAVSGTGGASTGGVFRLRCRPPALRFGPARLAEAATRGLQCRGRLREGLGKQPAGELRSRGGRRLCPPPPCSASATFPSPPPPAPSR